MSGNKGNLSALSKLIPLLSTEEVNELLTRLRRRFRPFLQLPPLLATPSETYYEWNPFEFKYQEKKFEQKGERYPIPCVLLTGPGNQRRYLGGLGASDPPPNYFVWGNYQVVSDNTSCSFYLRDEEGEWVLERNQVDTSACLVGDKVLLVKGKKLDLIDGNFETVLSGTCLLRTHPCYSLGKLLYSANAVYLIKVEEKEVSLERVKPFSGYIPLTHNTFCKNRLDFSINWVRDGSNGAYKLTKVHCKSTETLQVLPLCNSLRKANAEAFQTNTTIPLPLELVTEVLTFL